MAHCLGERSLSPVLCTVLNSCIGVQKLENALNSLTENGFLIAREQSEAEISIPSSLNLCADVLFDGERVLLLRKVRYF